MDYFPHICFRKQLNADSACRPKVGNHSLSHWAINTFHVAGCWQEFKADFVEQPKLKGLQRKCSELRWLRQFACLEWAVNRCGMSRTTQVQLWHKETPWWRWCVSFVVWTRQLVPWDDHIPVPTVTDVGLNSNKGRLKCCLQVDKIRKDSAHSARHTASILCWKLCIALLFVKTGICLGYAEVC